MQLTIPVKLRGDVVGILKVKSEEHRQWTVDELDIVNAIVERAALSIEGARLLTESRRVADKERIISEITARVSSFTNRENILLTAVEEIGRALPGADVALQINSEDKNELNSE